MFSTAREDPAMEIQLPDDFRCPISLEIMADPVILPSGHTFDRSSIQKWLDAGNRTCPISKFPIPDSPCLIPNHVLRSLIYNHSRIAIRVHDYPELQTYMANLISESTSVDDKLESLYQLNQLSKRSLSFRRRITDSGGVSAAIKCMNSIDCGILEKSLSLLLNLSLDDDNKVGIVAEGGVGRIVAVLRGGSDSRAVAATVLTSLAVVEVNKATIGAYPDAIRALVSLLRDGNVREKREASTALFTLCSFHENRSKTVECGAVPILVAIAESGLDRAVEVLGLLVKCRDGVAEMVNLSRSLPVLVNVVKNGSSRGVQYALLCLKSLCCYSGEFCFEAQKDGVVEICVGLLEDDNEKVRKNALSLMNLLRRKWSYV